MSIVHDAKYVAEWIGDGCRNESIPAVGERFVFLGPHGFQSAEGGLYIIDMPIHDRSAGAERWLCRGKTAIDETQLVLVVSNPKLGVSRFPVGT